VNLNFKSRLQNIPNSAKLAAFIVILAKILVLTIGYAVTYLNNGPAPPLYILTNMFFHWDAPHYVAIAKNGYVNTGDAANFIVFFPLYPALIRVFTLNFNYASLTALIISNVSSLVAFAYLYKLAKLEFNESVALKAVLFLSVFPTAYFLSVPYTEGLFFALAIGCIYYARRSNWQLAGLISLFAGLTRIEGLILLPALLVEYLHQKGWKPRKIDLNILWTLSSLGGFLIYLDINNQVTGNPFTFLTVEAAHWNNRLDPKAGLLAAYSWATTAKYPDNITAGLAPLLFAIFGLMILGISVWQRMRPVYITYMFFCWGLAVSTSWWISVPRYVMGMFPMFMLFGLLSNRRAVNIAIVVLSGALLCFFTVFFALDLWAF